MYWFLVVMIPERKIIQIISIPLNFQLLTTGMTALNHGLTLKMELDFPYSTLLEMFGGF